MENPPRVPRITTNTIQRNRNARTQLPRTTTQDHRRRTRMGSRNNPPRAKIPQHLAILGLVERLCTSTRLVGKPSGHVCPGPYRPMGSKETRSTNYEQTPKENIYKDHGNRRESNMPPSSSNTSTNTSDPWDIQ